MKGGFIYDGVGGAASICTAIAEKITNRKMSEGNPHHKK